MGLFFSTKRKQEQLKGNNQIVRDDEDILDALLTDYIDRKKSQIIKLRVGKISKAVFMDEARIHLIRHFRVDGEQLERVLTLFENFLFSYFRLTPLMEKPDVSDIHCVAYDNISYKENGVREMSDIKFRSEKEFENFIKYVATRNKANVSNLNALQRFTDHNSHKDYIYRFTVVMPLVTTYDKPYLQIRKQAKDFPEIKDLIRKGMMTPKIADMLIERFQTGSTLICGAPSAGKTHLLNALKETLPDEISVCVSQQADELLTKRHPRMYFMHSVTENSESKVNYDLEKISDSALTFDIDFFIIGEVKGKEAMQLLNVCYSGMLSAATIHAPSAGDAPERMVDMAMRAGSGFSREELMVYFAAFKTIIFVEKYKVNEVYEVAGWDRESKTMKYNVLFERKGEPWEL